MKKEIWLGKKTLRFFYFRYKDTPYFSLSITFFVMLICVILFFYIIIPQLQSWFSIREEVLVTREKIKIINNNINFMRNINKSLLDEQTKVVSSALPVDKDFGAVLNTISNAAIASNTSLDDFSFVVGTEETPYMSVSLVARGTIKTIKNFVRELEERLPISQVVELDGSVQAISVRMQFYYEKSPKIIIQEDAPIKPLSESKVTLLQKLSEWRSKNVEVKPSTSPASSSASLF